MPPSPFASKLGTNYCPPDEELAQINNHLIEPRLRLNCLDDEITTLQNAIQKLAEERDTLVTYVEAHRALTSPLRRFPRDIIEEIFMACLPPNRNCVMSCKEAPVILGRICSSWRTISLSTPRLWATLHIAEPPLRVPYGPPLRLYKIKVAQRLEVAKAWLARSGTCPLSISLETNSDTTETPPPNTDLFFNALVPFASRWQNVRLVISSLALQALSRLTEDDVPMLKHFDIVERKNIHSRVNNEWSLSHSSVLHAANLSRFYISGPHANFAELPLRWNQLTELSGIEVPQTSQVLLGILSMCPKLRTCRVLVHDRPNGNAEGPAIDCTFIHTFELRCRGSALHTAQYLLGRLSLPHLRDFTLRGTENRHNLHAATVNSLLSSLASSTHLESISIDSDSFSKSYFVDFLRGLPPTIQRLCISDRSLTWHIDGALDDDVLATLFVSPDHPTLVPALQDFVIEDCRKVSDNALRHFIISRMTALRRVQVDFQREMQIDILLSLQSFVETGLQTSIRYIPSVPMLFSPWQGLPDAPPSIWRAPLLN